MLEEEASGAELAAAKKGIQGQSKVKQYIEADKRQSRAG